MKRTEKIRCMTGMFTHAGGRIVSVFYTGLPIVVGAGITLGGVICTTGIGTILLGGLGLAMVGSGVQLFRRAHQTH